MKTRHVKGRRISGVVQYRFADASGGIHVAVSSVELEDGKKIHLRAEETESEPVVTVFVTDREGRRLS